MSLFTGKLFHSKKIIRHIFVCLFFSFYLIIPLKAQNSIIVSRLEEAIKFDGSPDEKSWSKIIPLPVTTLQPVAGKEPSEKYR
jgi:hypothetical protein